MITDLFVDIEMGPQRNWSSGTDSRSKGVLKMIDRSDDKVSPCGPDDLFLAVDLEHDLLPKDVLSP